MFIGKPGRKPNQTMKLGVKREDLTDQKKLNEVSIESRKLPPGSIQKLTPDPGLSTPQQQVDQEGNRPSRSAAKVLTNKAYVKCTLACIYIYVYLYVYICVSQATTLMLTPVIIPFSCLCIRSLYVSLVGWYCFYGCFIS